MSGYTKLISHRVEMITPEGANDVILEETSSIERDEDGDPEVVSTRLVLRGPHPAKSSDGEDLADALFELERTLAANSYFKICHQCRFGCTHPFQGNEWWCLAHVPRAADEIQQNGKYGNEDLGEVQIVEVAPTDTCPRFEGPREPRGVRPGTPERC